MVSTITCGVNLSLTNALAVLPRESLKIALSINLAQASVSCSIFFGSTRKPVFLFTTSPAPSISKLTPAWRRALMRQDACKTFPKRAMHQYIRRMYCQRNFLRAEQTGEFEFTFSPASRILFFICLDRLPSPINSQMQFQSEPPAFWQIRL